MSGPDNVAPPFSSSLAAFTALVERHHHSLYTFLRHLIGDDEQANDLLHDTLYEALRAARKGTPPFGAASESDDDQQRRWLFRVAYHKGIALWRRRRLIHWESLEVLHRLGKELNAEATAFEDTVIAHVDLRAALAQCSPQDRACFLLSEAHELSAAEVGQILDASPESVRKRLSRTKQRLRRLYLAQHSPTKEAIHA